MFYPAALRLISLDIALIGGTMSKVFDARTASIMVRDQAQQNDVRALEIIEAVCAGIRNQCYHGYRNYTTVALELHFEVRLLIETWFSDAGYEYSILQNDQLDGEFKLVRYNVRWS